MNGIFFEDDNESTKEGKFFSNVVGYTDIKKLLLRSIVSKESVHVLLTGPPSSSKTVFLLEMLDGLDNAYFIDAVGTSCAGMVDYLFNNSTKYLLIDEIDKMKKSDQAALLNVMDTGILSETKLNGKTRQKKMNLSILLLNNGKKERRAFSSTVKHQVLNNQKGKCANCKRHVTKQIRGFRNFININTNLTLSL